MLCKHLYRLFFCALSSKGIPLPKCPAAPSGKRLHSGKSLKRPSRSGSSRVDWRRCEPRHTAWRRWRKPSVKRKGRPRSETFLYCFSVLQSTALLCILLVFDSGDWYFFLYHFEANVDFTKAKNDATFCFILVSFKHPLFQQFSLTPGTKSLGKYLLSCLLATCVEMERINSYFCFIFNKCWQALKTEQEEELMKKRLEEALHEVCVISWVFFHK